MRLSEQYQVPRELSLLYDFVNSVDLRRFIEQGAQHTASDELATASQFEEWLRAHGLRKQGVRPSSAEHRNALMLRTALRAFLEIAPDDRAAHGSSARLSDACVAFPLVLAASNTLSLVPTPGSQRLSIVLVELFVLAQAGRLDRLKMCASEECHWIFYDRSKPASRRWCSSVLCGNRQKTRAYRQRQRGEPAALGSR
jgi:predicted RNA-binding Zn ribbon-like protein